MNNKDIQSFIQILKNTYPDATCSLDFKTPFQMVVAVMLSAQCTDERVNKTTPALFERYSSVKSMAESSQEEIYSYIKSISYPNSKSRNLKKMAERLHEVYHDEIPDDPQELQTLADHREKRCHRVYRLQRRTQRPQKLRGSGLLHPRGHEDPLRSAL